MAQRKSRKAKKGEILASAITKVGEHSLVVVLRRLGRRFSLRATLEEKPRRDRNGLVFCPDIPLAWSWLFSEKEADALVHELGLALGYEISGHRQPRTDYPWILDKPKGRLEILSHVPSEGPTSSVLVSRKGAGRLFRALAGALRWQVTG